MVPIEVTEFALEHIARLVMVPDAMDNKYSRGKVALVAGSAAYPGAACLCADAATRSGAGYTQVVCAPQTVPLVQMHRPSLVATAWDNPVAEQAINRAKAVCLGSGFDAQDDLCQAVTLAVINGWASPEAPLLIDGGALGIVATVEGRRALRHRTAQGGATVLTPHEREAARLALPLGLDAPAGPQDVEGQIYLAKNLALYYSCIVVLKGPVTYISDGENVIRVAEGTPALAKAGTGDVLAGIIGALMAQGLNPLDAAVLGVEWHGLAGKAAERRLTSICVCAEDVVAELPTAARQLLDLLPQEPPIGEAARDAVAGEDDSAAFAGEDDPAAFAGEDDLANPTTTNTADAPGETSPGTADAPGEASPDTVDAPGETSPGTADALGEASPDTAPEKE